MTSRFATITESDLGCQRERTKNVSEMNQIKKTYYSQFFFLSIVNHFLVYVAFPPTRQRAECLDSIKVAEHSFCARSC